MRTTALLTLLPLLATLSLARPHQPGHDHSLHRSHRIRKSLSFGPTHSHASFEVIDEPVAVQSLLVGEVDVKEVAKRYIGERIGSGDGEGFYIREDVSAAPTIPTVYSPHSKNTGPRRHRSKLRYMQFR